MHRSAVALAVLAMGATSAPSMAASSSEPPMNDFLQAFYTCDGGSFLVAYDSDTPASATITANTTKKTYALKRTPAPSGALFAAAGVKFWTDGKTATFEAAAAPLKNCKKKAG